MATATLTLAEFLLARIDEDEADVAGHAFDYAPRDTGIPQCRHESHRTGYSPDCWRAQVAARVLAECEAKRRTVEAYGDLLKWDTDEADDHGIHGQRMGLEFAVRALATVYADRPGYREEWRP